MSVPTINFDSDTFDFQVVDDVVVLRGFAQTPNRAGYVRIYSNGEFLGQADYGLSRPEPALGNQGFLFEFNSRLYAEGPVTIEAEAFDASGNFLGEAFRQLVIDRMDQRGVFEGPSTYGAGPVALTGWALAKGGFQRLEVLLNGELLGVADSNAAARPDVQAAFPEYADPLPGFSFAANFSAAPQGYNRLSLMGVQADGTRQQITERDVLIDAGVQALGRIETPGEFVVTDRGTSMPVTGWVVSNSAPTRIEVYLDDRLVGSTTTLANRADVAAGVPGYSFARGWTVNVSDALLGEGEHDLRVVAVLQNGQRVGLDGGQDGLREFEVVEAGRYVGAHLNPQNDYAVPIQQFQAATGVDPDVVMYYSPFNGPPFNTFPFLPQDIGSTGAVPMVTWEAYGYTLRQVAQGNADSYITSFATEIKNFANPVYIRLNHEFNSDYYPWSGSRAGTDNTPQLYVDAWRRVVDLVEGAGATNARFIWAPSYKGVPTIPEDARDLKNYYPGDGYVDFIGVSGYNWANDPVNGSGWQTAKSIYTVFAQQIRQIAPDKPILISEIGTSPDYEGNSAAQWIRDAFSLFDGMDQVKGVVWFNDRAYQALDGMDFRVADVTGQTPGSPPVPAARTQAFGQAAGQWMQEPGEVAFAQNLMGSATQIVSAGSRVQVGAQVLGGDGLRLKFADGLLSNRDGDALFDGIFYGNAYRDVYLAGIDAKGHYSQYGWLEGKDPSAFFSTAGYRSLNADVRNAGINPLEHFRTNGAGEGRDPSWQFDLRLYNTYNPDVAAAGINPLAHYLLAGAAEGRKAWQAVGGSISNGFDSEFYLLRYADVGLAGVAAEAHYRNFGWKEGRDPNAWFDTAGYRNTYTDVKNANIDPLAHYMIAGWKEGRDPSRAFDTSSYLAANADVAAAGINPLQHFLVAGIYEQRSPQTDNAWG